MKVLVCSHRFICLPCGFINIVTFKIYVISNCILLFWQTLFKSTLPHLAHHFCHMNFLCFPLFQKMKLFPFAVLLFFGIFSSISSGMQICELMKENLSVWWGKHFKQNISHCIQFSVSHTVCSFCSIKKRGETPSCWVWAAEVQPGTQCGRSLVTHKEWCRYLRPNLVFWAGLFSLGPL